MHRGSVGCSHRILTSRCLGPRGDGRCRLGSERIIALSPGKSRGVAFLHLKAVACDGRAVATRCSTDPVLWDAESYSACGGTTVPMSGKAGGSIVTARGTQPRGRGVVVPADWTNRYEDTHIPAAVWAGDTLRVSSHAGESPDDVFPDDPEEQLRGAFRNIASSLAVAGASWSDVV